MNVGGGGEASAGLMVDVRGTFQFANGVEGPRERFAGLKSGGPLATRGMGILPMQETRPRWPCHVVSFREVLSR